MLGLFCTLNSLVLKTQPTYGYCVINLQIEKYNNFILNYVQK